MFSGNAIYWNIYRLLIVYQLYHGRCASCIGLMIYYILNILLLLKNRNLNLYMVLQHDYVKNVMMHMNWLMQLCTYIKLLG